MWSPTPYLSLLLSLITLIQAFTSISVPRRIKAGNPTEIEITNDLASPNSTDATTDAYRIYLWHIGGMCYLVRQSAIDITRLNIVIPPSVGPNDHYNIISMQVTLSPTPFRDPIYTVSTGFNLTGATGLWSDYETNLVVVRSVIDPDRVPCYAMSCARACVADFNEDRPEEMEDRAHHECLRACPGVDYPPWEEYKHLTTITPSFSSTPTPTSLSTYPTSLNPSPTSHQTTNSTNSTTSTITTPPIEPTLTPQPPPVAPIPPSTPTAEPTKSQSPDFAISMEVFSLLFLCCAVHFGGWVW